jgi:hypothetical protein
MKIAVMFAIAAICLAAFVAASRPGSEPDFTREVRLDTIGTMGFNIRRTIENRVVGSPDPILTARESLSAQTGLCPRKYELLKITIVSEPPTLTYEASIRCW